MEYIRQKLCPRPFSAGSLEVFNNNNSFFKGMIDASFEHGFFETWVDPSLERCLPGKAYLKIVWQHFTHSLMQELQVRVQKANSPIVWASFQSICYVLNTKTWIQSNLHLLGLELQSSQTLASLKGQLITLIFRQCKGAQYTSKRYHFKNNDKTNKNHTALWLISDRTNFWMFCHAT